jgi:hypothetical protein
MIVILCMQVSLSMCLSISWSISLGERLGGAFAPPQKQGLDFWGLCYVAAIVKVVRGTQQK